MSLSRFVVCLSLLVSSLAFAQPPEEWTPYAPPAPETATPPPLVPAPTPPEPQPPPRTSQPVPQDEIIPRDRLARGLSEDQLSLRLIISPWVGFVSGMVGLVAGAIPTMLGSLPFCVDRNGRDQGRCGIAALTGATLSYTMGVSMGITMMNSVLGGRGDGLATFLGGLAGAAAGAGIAASTQSVVALVLGLIFGPLIGAVTTYEVSHARNSLPDTLELEARSGFKVMPLVSATPRGGILGGLAVRF